MLLHIDIYWPEGLDLMLWPFALKYTDNIWNCLPDMKAYLSPLDIYSRTISDHTDLSNSHVWRCPTYVLDPTLHDGKKLTKWNLQKRCRQCLGWSQNHSLTVALIKNLCTGSISLQFHTVMDDCFSTIARVRTNNDFVLPDNWEDLFKVGGINLLTDWDPATDGILLDLAIEWLSEGEIYACKCHGRYRGRAFNPPPSIDTKLPNTNDADDMIPQGTPASERDDGK
eukprot:8928939-Ditylum_brightwellii.AAC.1